jgi:hypothetical protein
MALPEIVKTGRLAMREEGTLWVAYYALPDTMEGALYLGSIRMAFLRGHPERRNAFLKLMRESVNDIFEIEHGLKVEVWKEEPAPESERGGNA